jgi:hypothetical protein
MTPDTLLNALVALREAVSPGAALASDDGYCLDAEAHGASWVDFRIDPGDGEEATTCHICPVCLAEQVARAVGALP